MAKENVYGGSVFGSTPKQPKITTIKVSRPNQTANRPVARVTKTYVTPATTVSRRGSGLGTGSVGRKK
jgi:hypothetical protein